MNKPLNMKSALFFQIPVLLATLLLCQNSLAEVKLKDKIDNIEGYPYNLLIQRSDQVSVIYKGDKQISCRVEIQKGEQHWTSDTQQVSAKKFNQSPLRHCLNREQAKQILASTF